VSRRGLIAGVAALAAPHVARAQQAITLRLGHVDNPSTSAGVGLEAFAAEVARLSGGSLKVQVFHAGQLGAIPEEIKNVLSGSQDMHFLTPEFLTTLIDETKIISAPYVFRSHAHQQAFFKSAVFKPGLDKLRALGAVVLDPDWTWLQKDPRGLISVRAVRTPDDLKGIKLRIWESKTAIDTWRGLGAETIVIARPEMYLAFKQNIIQGGPEPLGISVDQKNVEVAKFWTRTEEYYQVNNIMINERRLNGLSAAHRDALRQAAKIAAETYTAESLRGFTDKRGIAEKQYGVTVLEPDLAPWRAKAKDVLVKMEAEGTLPKGLAQAASQVS
jgi:TRAP-type C4-dicarboxylate transport system substrate-binding protein